MSRAAPGPFVPRAAAGPGCAPGKGGAAPRGRELRRLEAPAGRRVRAFGASWSLAPLLAGHAEAIAGPFWSSFGVGRARGADRRQKGAVR